MINLLLNILTYQNIKKYILFFLTCIMAHTIIALNVPSRRWFLETFDNLWVQVVEL